MIDRPEWPPRFDEWNRSSQVAYVELRWDRLELLRAIGRRAGIDSLVERPMEPTTARINKEELAALALFVGIHYSEHRHKV